MGAVTRILAALGHAWGRVESLLGRLWRRVRRSRRRLAAEAREIGEDARQIGAVVEQEVMELGAGVRELGAGVAEVGRELWDRVDDLPFVPTFLKIIPVRNQFYGHGAFMGAAPALLGDARWRRILAFLMPDVYEQVTTALGQGAEAPSLIPMFENNPVMCAFGVWRNFESRVWLGREGDNDLAGMEWDVFIDSDLARDLEAAPAAERAERVARIVETMVIAHASTTDTVQEAIGICQYADVRKTPKTALGGVEYGDWLDLFARALLLVRAPEVGSAIREMQAAPRVVTDEECRRNAFVHRLPVSRALDLYREVTGGSRFSVVLEIKSLSSTAGVLREMVAELNRQGILVVAVASFQQAEIDGVGAMVQRVDGADLPGPREVLFFHYAGDLQEACDEGRIRPGQSVMFNGASLLDVVEGVEGGRPTVRVRDDVLDELATYRARHDLHVGLYVQEGDCDHAAAELLSDLMQTRESTFELGFAWGGLQDEVAIQAEGEPRLGYGSQKALGMVGRARLWRLPTSEPDDVDAADLADDGPEAGEEQVAPPPDEWEEDDVTTPGFVPRT